MFDLLLFVLPDFLEVLWVGSVNNSLVAAFGKINADDSSSIYPATSETGFAGVGHTVWMTTGQALFIGFINAGLQDGASGALPALMPTKTEW